VHGLSIDLDQTVTTADVDDAKLPPFEQRMPGGALGFGLGSLSTPPSGTAPPITNRSPCE
jgi:hypothetical protein